MTIHVCLVEDLWWITIYLGWVFHGRCDWNTSIQSLWSLSQKVLVVSEYAISLMWLIYSCDLPYPMLIAPGLCLFHRTTLSHLCSNTHDRLSWQHAVALLKINAFLVFWEYKPRASLDCLYRISGKLSSDQASMLAVPSMIQKEWHFCIWPVGKSP